MEWWENASFYHLYLPSFADGNADGFGDLIGVRQRADYLAWLGVDAVWLSPFCRSRMEDFGYDVTDYFDVDPAFGSMDDLHGLVDDLHQRGIRVVMDLVVNHSSRHHPWFIEASSHRGSPKRDWYLWSDPAAEGGPPNNWRSIEFPATPGSAWYWHEPTGQYFYSSFAHTQPDLNWRNPELVAQIHEVVDFWLGHGIDGFRLDMIDFVGKDPAWRSEPDHSPDGDYFSSSELQLSLPETLRHLGSIREVTDRYPDRVLIGEVGGLIPLERLVALHGSGTGLDLAHNFRLLYLDWNAEDLQRFVSAYNEAMQNCSAPNWVLTNHDMPRTTVRGRALSRLGLMLLLTLPGAAFLYYGEEIGMTNAVIPADRVRDPYVTPETGLGRDPSRTPMQWTPARHAGFSPVEPWLPVTADHSEINVVSQQTEHSSQLHLVRDLLRARRDQPALATGSYAPSDQGPATLAYFRHTNDQTAFVALNFSETPTNIKTPDMRWLGCIHPDRTTSIDDRIDLGAYQGIVLWT